MATAALPSSLTLSPEDLRIALASVLRVNKYMKEFPFPKQAAFLALPHSEAFFGGAGGPGKAVVIDTVLPTPNGWIKMGDVSLGNQLFDEQGIPCTVLATSDIFENRDIYDVCFSDGSVIRADGEHLWSVWDMNTVKSYEYAVGDRIGQYPGGWSIWSPKSSGRHLYAEGEHEQMRLWRAEGLTAAQIGKRLGRTSSAIQQQWSREAPRSKTICPQTTKDISQRLYVRGSNNYGIPTTEPLQLPESILPIHPYVFGYLLGDGDTNGCGRVACTPEDRSWLMQEFRRIGYDVSPQEDRGHFHISDITTIWGSLSLQNEKYIPDYYLRSSYWQRLSIVQGLIDSDGYVDNNGAYRFSNTNKKLIDGFCEIITSLGNIPQIHPRPGRMRKENIGKPSWDIIVPSSVPLARLPRKYHQARHVWKLEQNTRYITAIRPVSSEPVRCITVDSPSHLYLAGRSMIPTHNSSALLMGGLQYVDMPGYAGLILRRSYSDLSLPGALMDRAHDWLDDTDAIWKPQEHAWHFPPHDTTLTFGYLQNENDKFRYRSAAFQYCGYDELTQFTEPQYTYLFSRLRRLSGQHIPLRMRSASNPGDSGHQWVKRRFLIEGKRYGRGYVPAQMADNPALDVLAYRQSLAHLDPVTRQQIEDGNWDVLAEGNMFKRVWFPIVVDYPRGMSLIRCWDFAATEVKPNTDPDWTSGTLMGEKGGQYWLIDVKRDRLSPKGVEDLVKQTAQLDGRDVEIWIEQEPGSSGLAVVQDYQRRVLKGFTVYGKPNSGSKVERAKPASSAAEAGNIFLIEGAWNGAWLDEVALFPFGAHDDQVDNLSLGVYVFMPAAEGKRAGAWGR